MRSLAFGGAGKTRLSAALLGACAASCLAACGYQNANPAGLPAQDREFVIGTPVVAPDHGQVDDDLVAGLQISYSDALERDRRFITAQSVPYDERFEALRSGKIHLTFGCLGELVDELDAHKGRLMRKLYAEDEDRDPAEWRNIMHGTLTSLLPGDIDASDAGIAEGCEDDSLPQAIVALYDKSVIDRGDRLALNQVAGGVSAEMLRERGQGS